MKSVRWVLLIAVLVVSAGCYASSIDTGRKASTKMIRKPWASCWIYGLVPPKTVETATECPDGVARVETKLSFLNQLVGGITFGIYTPMTIMVTCAEGPTGSLMGPEADITLAKDASIDEIQDAFAKAADQAVRTHQAVLVRTTP